MARLRTLMFLMPPLLAIGFAGCGTDVPEATGEPYEPSPEMQDMADQMMNSYKKGEINKAQ